MEQRGKPFNKRKASTDHWYSVSIGSAKAQIDISLVNKDHRIRIELWIVDDKKLFDSLYHRKTDIEEALDTELVWYNPNNKKSCSISTNIYGLDFTKQENYPELMNTAIDWVIKMRKVFTQYL